MRWETPQVTWKHSYDSLLLQFIIWICLKYMHVSTMTLETELNTGPCWVCNITWHTWVSRHLINIKTPISIRTGQLKAKLYYFSLHSIVCVCACVCVSYSIKPFTNPCLNGEEKQCHWYNSFASSVFTPEMSFLLKRCNYHHVTQITKPWFFPPYQLYKIPVPKGVID